MKKLFLLPLLFFSFISINAQSDFLKDSLDIYVSRALEMWQIPGAAVCVVVDGKVLIAKGYGVLELGKNEKVDANTLFMIGSNTKAFTSTCLALLENEDRLSMNDKVQKWLPDFRMKDPWVSKEINLTDIVTHRMGLQTFQGDFMYWTSDLTTKEVIEKFGKLTPVYGFRSRYGYTNAGYAIAGEVIKAVTDTSWNDFVKARIFNPLHMDRTLALSTDYFKAENTAKPHTYVDGKMSVIPFQSIDNLAPCGSIGSSVNDLSHWLIAQLDNGDYEGKNIIPSKVINRTRQPFTIQGRSRAPFNTSHYALYGLGWVLEDYEGKEIVSHTGGVNGFVTSVTLIPEEKAGIVVLTNNDQNLFFYALRYEITDALLHLPYRNYNQFAYDLNLKGLAASRELLAAQRDTVGMNLISDAPLDEFEGTYNNDVYGFVKIKKQDSHLDMSFEHHSRLIGKLESLGGSRFLCTYSDPTYGTVVLPFKVEDGKVKSFTLSVDPFVEVTTYEFIKE